MDIFFRRIYGFMKYIWDNFSGMFQHLLIFKSTLYQCGNDQKDAYSI